MNENPPCFLYVFFHHQKELGNRACCSSDDTGEDTTPMEALERLGGGGRIHDEVGWNHKPSEQ